MPRRIHEYRVGGHGRIRQRPTQKQIRRRFYPRQQCPLHKHCKASAIGFKSGMIEDFWLFGLGSDLRSSRYTVTIPSDHLVAFFFSHLVLICPNVCFVPSRCWFYTMCQFSFFIVNGLVNHVRLIHRLSYLPLPFNGIPESRPSSRTVENCPHFSRLDHRSMALLILNWNRDLRTFTSEFSFGGWGSSSLS